VEGFALHTSQGSVIYEGFALYTARMMVGLKLPTPNLNVARKIF